MVHNGIEYGTYGSLCRGLGHPRAANVGKQEHAIDAETTPLRDPEHYQYDFDLPDIAEVWRRGSVIASWLLDLTATALLRIPSLSGFAGRVSDSGEGRWTIKAAIDEAVPAHVLTAALYERFSSRGEADFANKMLSAMRYQFGGHLEKRPVSNGCSEEAMTMVDPHSDAWFSSAPPAIWRTRRSFRHCRRYRSAATSMCRSSAWPRPVGLSTSSRPG